MEENIDYISFTGGDRSSWHFFIAGTARTAREEHDEILSMARKVFDISCGLYLPTKIVYGYKLCNPKDSAYSQLESSMRPTFIEVRSNDSLTSDQLMASIRSIDHNSMAIYVRSIFFQEGKTLFSLKDKDVYIDRTVKELYASYCDDDVMIPDPGLDDDPLTIELFHDDLKDENHRVGKWDAAHYRLVFRTRTGMWFEHSELGTVNRDRLKAVFKRVYSDVNIVHAAFSSDIFSDEVLGLNT